MKTCPKCGYQRTGVESSEIPDYECPQCGIVYIKYMRHIRRQNAKAHPASRAQTLPDSGGGLNIKKWVGAFAVFLVMAGVMAKFPALALILPLLALMGGVYAFKRYADKKQLEAGGVIEKEPQLPPTHEQSMLAHAELMQHKTNHVLHFLISVVTLGAWLFVWFFVAASNTFDRNQIKRKNGMRTETNLPAIALVFFTFFVAYAVSRMSSMPDNAQVSQVQEAPKNAKLQTEHCFSAWDGSHIQFARLLKKAMNDPGSYEHVSTRFFDQHDGTIRLVMTFRGANKFGAKVLNTVSGLADIETCNVLSVDQN